jgi:transposase
MKAAEVNLEESLVQEKVHRTNGKASNYQPAPDPELKPLQRRRLTLAYKIKVIEAVGRLREEGETGAIGAYLRKEGLYYSSVAKWEHQYDQGKLTSTRTGPTEKSREELQDEIKRLRRKLNQTEKKLGRTQLLVEIQKKLSSILEYETEEITGKNDAK